MRLRKIKLELTIDLDSDNWQGYEDVVDELVVEDVFENFVQKSDANITLVKNGVWNIMSETKPTWDGNPYTVITGWISRSNPLKPFLYGLYNVMEERDLDHLIKEATTWMVLDRYIPEQDEK